MAHNWGIYTIATGRGPGGRGITRSDVSARARHRPDDALAIRSRGWDFRSVQLGGARGPGLRRVRTLGGRRRRAAILRHTSGLGRSSGLGGSSRLEEPAGREYPADWEEPAGCDWERPAGQFERFETAGREGIRGRCGPLPLPPGGMLCELTPPTPHSRPHDQRRRLSTFTMGPRFHGVRYSMLYALQLDVLSVNLPVDALACCDRVPLPAQPQVPW